MIQKTNLFRMGGMRDINSVTQQAAQGAHKIWQMLLRAFHWVGKLLHTYTNKEMHADAKRTHTHTHKQLAPT